MKVQKVGNSYMISIPKSVVKKLNIKKGDKFDFRLKDSSSLTYLAPTKTNFNDFIGNLSIPGFDLMEAIKSYKTDQYEDKIKRSYGKNLS
jgi:AbrB family looped-hinge helix DNA binding protein